MLLFSGFVAQVLSKSSYPSLPHHGQQPGSHYSTSQMNGYPGNGGHSNHMSQQSNGRVASYHQDRHMYNIPPPQVTSSHSYGSHKGGWLEGERTEYNHMDYYQHHNYQAQQPPQQQGHHRSAGSRQMAKAAQSEKTTEL